MKHTIKKVMAVFLVVTVLCTGSQSSLTNVQATESPDFIDVSASSSSLRTGPGKANSPLAEVCEGRVLKVIDQCTNEHDHIWYEVAWENEPGDALVLGAASTAGVTSVADGPLPVGEMIGAILVAGTICLSLSGVIPNELQKITTKVDFVEYLKNNGKMCTDTNFRMVGRVGDTLEVINDKCLSIPQAFVYARFCHGDVWTPDETGSVAAACAAFNLDYYGPEVDKDQPGYYYHYHMGVDHDTTVGGHIFYGKGQFTNCVPVGAY